MNGCKQSHHYRVEVGGCTNRGSRTDHRQWLLVLQTLKLVGETSEYTNPIKRLQQATNHSSILWEIVEVRKLYGKV